MVVSHALAFVCFVTILLGDVTAADIVRFGYGRGHLASKADNAEWHGLRLGDEIPRSSHLRTSPASPIRIELPSGFLCLAGETDLNLDADARRIVLERGRLLIRNLRDEGSWTVVTGTTTFDCLPGSELEISYAETIGANILKGDVQVTQLNVVAGGQLLKSPVEWIGNDQGNAKSSVPTGDDWASRIRQRTEPREEQGLGQLIAKNAQSDSPVRLEVARYHVNVVLQPPVALVQIDQSFFNPYSRQEQGTFVFNLPEGASVSRFAMFVTPDQLIEGELIDRQRADQIYTSIVSRKRDPAILEQIGSNLFRMRVFPIFARDTKRILLDYTIPLVAERGRYRFELPLMSDLKPIWDFGITGTIHSPFAPGSISSQTHPSLEFIPAKDGSVVFSTKDRHVQPPPNLLVDFRAADDRKPTVRTFTADNTNQHFVVTLPESANPTPIWEPLPMDLLVLVDTSGNAGNLTKARLAARTFLENLRPQDRWQMGCVDVAYRPITSEWMTPRSSPARAAIRQLNEAFSLGESRLDGVLEESLQVFQTSPEDRRRVIVYLGDGEATMPSDRSCSTLPTFQKNRISRPVFHGIKLGDEKVPGTWLKQGTRQTGGRVFAVSSGAVALRDLFEWSLNGAPSEAPITSCAVENVPAEDLFHDGAWQRGRELHIYGRGKPETSLNLKLKLADTPEQVFHLDVNDDRRDEDLFTGRLWARTKLESLLDAGNLNEATRTSIVRLCQEWSLMSPYTAFLVLETEADYGRWNIPRQLRHRYWKPAGAVEAVPIPERLRQSVVPIAPPNSQAAPTTELTEQKRERVKDHLNAAKEALSQGHAAVAMSHLSDVRVDARRVDSKEFDSLLAEARTGLRRDVTLSELKIWKSLIDRHAGNPLPAIAPLMLNFSYGGMNPESLERHPHAMKLLKPAPKFNENKVTLPDFKEAIEETIGIPIVLDRWSLADVGISAELVVDIGELQDVSVRTLLDLTLEKYGLAVIPEKHLLRITTSEKAAERVFSQVYPVIDLVRSDVLPQPELLANPSLDLKTANWRATTELRLKKPISVTFVDNPLDDVLNYIGAEIGGPQFWIDTPALADSGISVNQSVSLEADKWPADLLLDEILEPLQLERVIRDGVIVITTMEKADELLETRLYSGAGLVDGTVQVPMRNRRPIAFGGMGFKGGAMGGGMGGGGFGGMGGGGMGGGFFGGIGGGGDGNPGKGNAGVADVAPPQLDEPEPDSIATKNPIAKSSLTWPQSNEFLPNSPQSKTAEFAAPWSWHQFNWWDPPSLEYDVTDTTNLIRKSTPGKWRDDDGEGGAIGFHDPSFSFVIRQTQRVHRQIQELFEKLRRMQKATRIANSVPLKRISLNDLAAWDYSKLMSLIEQSTPGKWEDDDGEGGNMSPHPLTGSLVIRQIDKIHEEVEQLFAQLRRARYVAESLPWMTSLEGIDDLMTFLDRPAVTDLPKNKADANPAEPKTADALRRLAVRNIPANFRQRWRSVSTLVGRPDDVIIRRMDARMEIALPDRILRAEGPRAAVAYPNLTLVEIDDWGDSVRQVADSLLPWLPHRSNEELARLFEITVEMDEASATTLRLTIPSHSDAWFLATFSKQTGTLTKWQSFLVNKLQYELKFAPSQVIAVDPQGTQLERWDLITDKEYLTILPLEAGWGGSVVVEPANPEAPLTMARIALRRGDHDAALKTFESLLRNQPQQPFLNFFLARTIAALPEPTAALLQRQRDALDIVAAAAPSDLLRLLKPVNFPEIKPAGFRDILLKVPEDRRTDDLWDQLTELSIGLNRYDDALADLDRAIERTTDDATRIQRQLSRVEVLLKNKQLVKADSAAKALVEKGISEVQLLELGDIFGRSEQPEIANHFFEQYLKTPNLSRREQCDVAYRQATWQKKGEARWRYLMAADAERTDEKHEFLANILSEADQPEDAEILGKLAGELKPGHVQTQLLIRQANLTPDKHRRAEIAYTLYQSHQLPESHVSWIIEKLDQAERYQEIIEILERRLRKSGKLDQSQLVTLANAYRTKGREIDSRRAMTEASKSKKN